MFPTHAPLLRGLVHSCAGRGSPNPRTSSRRPRPRPPRPSPPQRRRGDPADPTTGLNPHPSPPQSEPEMLLGGGSWGWGAQDAEEGRRRWGRGVGTLWCLGEGELGREPGTGERGHWRERAELGRRSPSPQRHRGRACYSARRSAGTRAAPVNSGSQPPPSPLPGPRTTPNPRGRRRSWSGCHIPAQSPHHPSPPRWTSGPWAAHRQGAGNPPRPGSRPGRALPSPQSPQPSPRLDFRLPLDAPSSVPPSPRPPAWSGGRREGGCAPCVVPAPPRPP